MKKLPRAFLCGVALLAFVPTAQAENAVAMAVQRLHLSPQQLLSLRDFLGPFNRGVAVEGSGNGLFVLRDARSMAYAGEFLLRTDANGPLTVDRVSGPATLDSAREVQVPLKLDTKARLQATAALADAQALAAGGMTQSALPAQDLAGAALTNAGQPASILQSRAVFFHDGSGYTASVRAAVPAAHGPVPLLRIIERYYAPIKSDGKEAWRSATVEADGDVPLGFADLESRYGCATPGPCAIRGRLPAAANLHVIRWGRQSIAAVPATLLVQLAVPQNVPAPDNPSPPEATAPQTSQSETPPAPEGTSPDTPQDPNGL